MTLDDAKVIALCEIGRCIEVARGRFGVDVQPASIKWDLRGLVAGKAYSASRNISLNPQLVAEGADAVKKTAAHEYAHIVTRALYADRRRIRSHGREWSAIMRAFGYAPERTHSHAFQRAQERRLYAYTCACPDRVHRISVVRVKRMAGGTRYRCAKCSTAITPKSN